MSRRAKPADALDLDLDDLPPAARWRAWMGRIEAAIFAAAAPVTREALASIVGRDANLEALIADIQAELVNRPYEIVAVAGGWAFRTRAAYAPTIRAICSQRESRDLSRLEALVLTAIAYFQPITRGQIGEFLGREVSRDTIAALRAADLIGAGPQPGAPYTFATTRAILAHFGFDSLRDLEDFEQLQDAVLRDRADGAGIGKTLGLYAREGPSHLIPGDATAAE